MGSYLQGSAASFGGLALDGLTYLMGARLIGHSPYSSSRARELRACCRAFCSLLLAFLFFSGRLCTFFWDRDLAVLVEDPIDACDAIDFLSTDAFRFPDPAMLPSVAPESSNGGRK